VTSPVTVHVRDILTTVRQIERAWQKKVPSASTEKYTPWMPSDVAQYVVLLVEAMAEAPGDGFLEVGCGPGTKMLLARELFGLDVHGFDRVPEYVDAATEHGLDVFLQDALTYRDYGKFDIVFLNRPVRDATLERELERLVWSRMRRGAVLILMNAEMKPPETRWLVVTDDWESKRGIWLKL
jgi:trans-aconitate methyltransferase